MSEREALFAFLPCDDCGRPDVCERLGECNLLIPPAVEPPALWTDVRRVVDEASPGTRIPPTDCTNHCGMGPCDCSGKWRVMDWKIDVPRLRELLKEADRG